jgi:hypothetical protein
MIARVTLKIAEKVGVTITKREHETGSLFNFAKKGRCVKKSSVPQ